MNKWCFSFRSFVWPRWFFYSRLWVWVAIFLSMLVCAMVAWVHVQQRRTLRDALRELENVRQARIDLGQGFLHISLADSADSPFRRAEGLALLHQAISSFERGAAELGVWDADLVEAFHGSVGDFESRLAEWGRGGRLDAGAAVALRVAFRELERQANLLDLGTQSHLRRLSEDLDFRFGVTLGAAIFLLAGICGVVFLASRIRDRFEAASRASEDRFRLAMESTSDGLWDRDVRCDTVYCSPTYWRMLGYEPEAAAGAGLRWEDLLHGEDRDVALGVHADCVEGRCESFSGEFRLKARDGSWKWIFGRGKAVGRDGTGRALRMIGTHVDITERKRTEGEREGLQAQLTQAQKMESVGQLAGGVAHDFNNMLEIILGNVDLALEEVDSSNPVFGDLQEIRKAAERSANLTRQLLAFARKQTIEPKVLDLNGVVDGMLNMLRRLIGEDIDLAWLPGSGVWSVKMDPSQVDQILANLFVNARDAIGGVGKVTIETQNMVLDADYCAHHAESVAGEYVLLAVSDSGCGMDKETLRHLFEPFFTTKEMGKGTGLGLATVYGIVKQNGGFINVYSEPGQGTTFRIYLPRHAGAGESPRQESAAVGRGGDETILVVEDEPSILRLAVSMLERQGYRVVSASTPGEALDLARAHGGEIHLLMTDVVMPGMNGRDLAEKLMSLYPNVRCLFMSGYTANVIVHNRVLDEGVNFIQKPFSKRDLAVRVRAVLDHGGSA